MIIRCIVYFWIKWPRVPALLSGTSTRKQFPLPLSISPNTHWPSRHNPLWYFLWKNLDSSISTIFGSPFSWNPQFAGKILQSFSHTILETLNHSAMVCVEPGSRSASKAILSCSTFWTNHICIGKL